MELRVIKGLLASLGIHLLLVIAPAFLPQKTNFSQNSSQVEIEILNPEDRKEKSIVRDSLLPEKFKVRESEDPLRFFSKERQRVEKQTRAEATGLTINRGNKTPANNSDSRLKNLFKVKTHNDSEIAAARDQAQAQSRNGLELPSGVSTTGEMLPVEVSVGSFTALNTDRYLFYSFFARVEELIRSPWENAVRWTLYNSPKVALEKNIEAHWVTEIKVVLNPQGELLKALVLKESGLRGFDQAAIHAFSRARLFPNPPKEMIESDGTIQMHYKFNVKVDPRAISRRQ